MLDATRDATDIPQVDLEAAEESGMFDFKNIKDARNRMKASIVARRGQPMFRQRLLRLYRGKCVITGCDAEQALEAAHICPYKGDHTNHSSNGLLLRADLHTLFDLRLIAIDTKDMSVVVAPNLKHTSYAEFDASRLMIPADCPLPSKQALDRHRKLAQF
jgi:predicted restriction endonuclease